MPDGSVIADIEVHPTEGRTIDDEVTEIGAALYWSHRRGCSPAPSEVWWPQLAAGVSRMIYICSACRASFESHADCRRHVLERHDGRTPIISNATINGFTFTDVGWNQGKLTSDR